MEKERAKERDREKHHTANRISTPRLPDLLFRNNVFNLVKSCSFAPDKKSFKPVPFADWSRSNRSPRREKFNDGKPSDEFPDLNFSDGREKFPN